MNRSLMVSPCRRGGRRHTPAAALALLLASGCVTEPKVDTTVSALEEATIQLADEIAAIKTTLNTDTTGSFNITGSPITSAILALGLVVSGWVTPTPATVWKKLFCSKKSDKPPGKPPEQLR